MRNKLSYKTKRLTVCVALETTCPREGSGKTVG